MTEWELVEDKTIGINSQKYYGRRGSGVHR
jgi:hypothetical protein